MSHTTLSIESTCDDTSIALVTMQEGFFHVHRMLTYTQNHTKHGGIVPEYASRDHAKWLPRITQDMWLQKVDWWVYADISSVKHHNDIKEYMPEELKKDYWERGDGWIKIDSITVASHPGLPWSLVAWITTAHYLSSYYELPLTEVNHIMWHVFSILLDRTVDIVKLPYLCLTVSGGHSDVYIIEKNDNTSSEIELSDTRHKRGHIWLGETIYIGPYTAKKIVQTMDDAVGEAYDKCAKMLWWPYPWGYRMDCLAQQWSDDEVTSTQLRKIIVKEQFSFSGIKSQMAALISSYEKEWTLITEELKKNIARQFQRRTTDALINKLENCIDDHAPQTIWVVWWVSANSELRKKVEILCKKHGLEESSYVPSSLRYCVDNAAMIAVPWLLRMM